MKEVILLGRINLGHLPIGGETTKNQNLLEELSRSCQVIPLDFYRNKQRPWIFPKTIWTLLKHPEATLILSTTASNVYGFIKFLQKYNPRRKIIHWIVGGEFDKLVQQSKFDIRVLNKIEWNLAQSEGMVRSLQNSGVSNALFVRNFRKISYFPQANPHPIDSNHIKFFYLSRIMKSKGVDLLLNVVSRLNSDGYTDRFSLDLYGKMEDSYKEEFNLSIIRLPNATYHGLLNLREPEGYDVLSTMDMMVFPTHHPSEGIAGVFIDAYIAGVPVLTTNWNYNKEVVKDHQTGILIPALDEDALYNAMLNVIEGKVDLNSLSVGARAEAEAYKAENVINTEYLQKIGIL